MSIDRTTYELYIMDYLDGRLDAVVVSELLLFLEQNPDLKDEFESIRNFRLEKNPDATSFDPSFLKKPSYDEVKHLYEPMIVARMEGDETIQDASMLNKASQLYPELKKDEQLFLQTRLQPDLGIVFRNKSRLKVFTLAAYYKPALRIAAVLLCISSIGLFISRNNQPEPQTAIHTRESGKPELTDKPGKKDPGSPSKNNPVEQTLQQPAAALAQKDPRKTNDAVVSVIANEPVIRHKEHIAFAIETKAVVQPVTEMAATTLIEPEPIAYRQPKLAADAVTAPEYIDFKTWVARRIKKEASFEGENTLLARINKATNADIVLEKDTAGKITRFEIAGLGFAFK